MMRSLALAGWLFGFAVGSFAAPLPTLADVDGKSVDLARSSAEIILLNRWASWCGPCRAEIPELVALKKTFSAAELAVYGINDEAPKIQKNARRRFSIDYPLLVDPGTLPQPLRGGDDIPETYLFDSSGKLLETLIGYPGKGEIEKIVRRHLDEKRRAARAAGTKP